MRENKGFTLIELLAVIVILAIIALIATPIILGIINDARGQAQKRSAELVYTGVQYAYTSSIYSGADGASVTTEPTAKELAGKFTVENTVINPDANGAAQAVATDATGFTVKTSDNAYCVVTVSTSSTYDVTVECGTE